MKRQVLAAVLIVIILASSIGYFVYSSYFAKPAPFNLVWGYSFTASEPIIVMKELNLPQKYHLNVTFTQFSDFRLKNSAFLGAKTDIDAGINPLLVATSYQKGISVECLLTTRIYIAPSNSFVVPKNSSIHSLADLKGKKIGIPDVASPPGILFMDILATKYGINATKDTQLSNPNPNLVAELIDKGDLDGGLLQDVPPTIRAVVSGKYNVLYDIGADWQKTYGNPAVISCLAIQKSLANTRPDVAANVVRMWAEAVAYVHSHTDSSLFQTVANTLLLNTPPTYKLYQDSILQSYIAKMDDSSTTEYSQALQLSLKYHVINSMPDNGWYTTQFAPLANQP